MAEKLQRFEPFYRDAQVLAEYASVLLADDTLSIIEGMDSDN